MGLDAQSGCQFIQIQSGLRAGEENSIVLEDRTEVVENFRCCENNVLL